MTVCVVTDPSAVMPRAWLDELPVRLVDLEIAWPDGRTEDGALPYAQIAGRLASSPRPPTTGAPSPGTYQVLITELLASHDGVLVVCPSSDLSTTFASAMLGAREIHDERVRVLDSKTAAAGQGMVAAEAARTAAAGGRLDDACDRAVGVAARMNIWATLSQLDFLRRSGRVPAVAALGAGALGLQPVVRYSGASPSLAGVVRSTEKGADRLFGAWDRTVTDGACHAIAFHSDRAQDAATIVRRIAERTPATEAHVVEVTASLASHTGPGLLGLAWFWDN